MKKQIGQFLHRQFRKNEIAIHELNYLFWECTLRCNLNCLHCGSDCKRTSAVEDMPFDHFLQAILPLNKVYKPGTTMVVITGGEPLMRSDLPECGLKLREHGFRWGIVTNGFAYNKENHLKLLNAGMGAITLSIDGIEETHNLLRGNPDSYSYALRALDLITSSPQLNYDVVTCVHQKNIDELEALKNLLIKHKTNAWRLFTIAPIGRAAHNPLLQLSNSQLRQMMDFIVKTRKEGIIDAKFSCEAFTGKYETLVRDSFFFCRAGINIGSVLIDGSISACPNINSSFIQGSIYKDNLVDVWENRFQEMRNRSWTQKGICKNCTDFKNCNGGALHLWDEKRNGILQCHKCHLEDFS